MKTSIELVDRILEDLQTLRNQLVKADAVKRIDAAQSEVPDAPITGGTN
jgi:hypothetical protein